MKPVGSSLGPKLPKYNLIKLQHGCITDRTHSLSSPVLILCSVGIPSPAIVEALRVQWYTVNGCSSVIVRLVLLVLVVLMILFPK